jgi:NADH-quinone oxidoreductase subunit F
VQMVLNLERFFAQESCGWCTPCRDGLPWVVEILEDLLAGRGRPEDLDQLAKLARLMGPGNTFCALAPGAAEPLQSALKYFREDFERYLEHNVARMERGGIRDDRSHNIPHSAMLHAGHSPNQGSRDDG